MSNAKLLAKIARAPKRPGIYRYLDSNGTILYVGKALQLKDRLKSYFQKDVSVKTRQMLSLARTIDWIETGSEFSALLLEALLIKLHQPHYNIALRDDKSYIYVFVSTGEEFPIVLLARKPKQDATKGKWAVFENLKGEYYGPFASSRVTRELLRKLRRVTPFCQQKPGSKRVCFYHHLGLCNPCPAAIRKTEGPIYQELKRCYRNQIRKLGQILSGKLDLVQKELTQEMRAFAEKLEFENAQAVKRQLRRFEWLLSYHDTSSVFLDNPNFYFDEQQKACDELQSLLRKHGVHLSYPHRIECFDIATFGGYHSFASQVVFIDGVPEKKEYRLYRMHKQGKPNDVAMLAEAVRRRLAHKEWPLPDLFIVDGGKPQVSTVDKILSQNQPKLPLVGLAKRNEQIIVPRTPGFAIISLNRAHQALQLLQAIRDEAHRFANSRHRQARTKHVLTPAS